MKNILKGILLYLFTINISFAADPQPVGSLHITVNLSNYGTTKSYDNIDGKLILDAGIINANDGLRDLKIAEVNVLMEAKPDVQYDELAHDACVIDGGFSGLLRLRELENKFSESGGEIRLSPLTKYNNAQNANLILKAQNFKITHKNIVDENMRDDTYVFSAYPDKCNFENKVLVFGYRFDLILQTENFNPGDIVRGDIALDSSTVKATSGKGALQDLIEDQIKSIMEAR